MKRLIGWGALLAFLLAGTALWFFGGRSAPAPVAPAAQVADRGAAGARPGAVARAQDPATMLRQRLAAPLDGEPVDRDGARRIHADMIARDPSQRWWLLPFDEVYAELRAAAEKGDARAQHVLGRRSADCLATMRDETPANLLKRLDEEMETENFGPYAQRRMANIRQQSSEALARFDACAGLDRAWEDESLLWLERAGRGDAAGAKLGYVSAWAKQLGGDRNALIAGIERVAAQRELAREWLEQGRAEGDDGALDLYIDAYSGANGLYPRDRVQELAYRYARDLVRGRRNAQFDSLWAKGPVRYDQDLTVQQWDAAEARGREIFKTYYEARPVWRNGKPPSLPPPPSPPPSSTPPSITG